METSPNLELLEQLYSNTSPKGFEILIKDLLESIGFDDTPGGFSLILVIDKVSPVKYIKPERATLRLLLKHRRRRVKRLLASFRSV